MPSIQEFISDSRLKGMAKGNRFTLYFNAPNSLSTFDLSSVRNIALYCSGANVPGLSLSTVPIRTTGEVREMPYDRNFQEMHVTFYADSTLQAKYFFDEWINSIQDRETRMFNYFDNYSIPILTVEVEDLNGETVYRVDLFDVYPKAIDAIQLHHGNTSFVEVSVSFVYRYWQSSQFVNGQIVSGPPPLGATNDPFVSLPGVIGDLFGGGSNAINSVTSIFGDALGGLNSAMGGFANQVGGFSSIIPSNLVSGTNTALMGSITSALGSGKNILGNITGQMASPAGINISLPNLSTINSQISTIKNLTSGSSSLASSISLFTPSSIPGITTQLNSILGNTNGVNSAINNLQSTVNSSIDSAASALSDVTGIAPNGLLG
jgi:hypothetical protein